MPSAFSVAVNPPESYNLQHRALAELARGVLL